MRALFSCFVSVFFLLILATFANAKCGANSSGSRAPVLRAIVKAPGHLFARVTARHR